MDPHENNPKLDEQFLKYFYILLFLIFVKCSFSSGKCTSHEHLSYSQHIKDIFAETRKCFNHFFKKLYILKMWESQLSDIKKSYDRIDNYETHLII